MKNQHARGLRNHQGRSLHTICMLISAELFTTLHNKLVDTFCHFISVLRMLSPVEGNCSENGVALAGSSGSLTSPNYPNNYPSDTTCRWIITVPEGHQVKVNFQAFDLETCFISSTCTCDHVEIRDGSDKSSYELAEFCGGRTPGVASILSSGRVMWIEFKSDRLTRHKGFNATYTAVGKRSHFSNFQSVLFFQSGMSYEKKNILRLPSLF